MGGGPAKEHMLILSWDPEPKELIPEIKRRFPHIDVTYKNVMGAAIPKGEDANKVPAELYKDATILVTIGILPPSVDLIPKVKFIHVFTAGIDHLMKHPIVAESDLPITTSSGVSAPPMAEWIVMATLNISRFYSTTYEWQKEHKWGPNPAFFHASDWVGKRVGIAGYGSIGRQTARIFNSLGASIVAFTAGPRPTAESRRDDGYIIPNTGDPDGSLPIAWYSGTTKESLHTFLRSGLDCLVICIPLTPSTEHLFGKAEFEMLKAANPRGCFLVNISRGKLLDQAALVEALNTGVLNGAALDVASPEPLPKDDPLWDAKNTVIAPHISAVTKEYMGRAYELLFMNIERWSKGEQMYNLVHRKRGY